MFRRDHIPYDGRAQASAAIRPYGLVVHRSRAKSVRSYFSCAAARVGLFCFGLAWCVAYSYAQPVATRTAPNLILHDQHHAASDSTISVGRFAVWEDRLAGKGRRLRLDVVVLPALERPAAPDPVFVIAGGPGQNVTTQADHWAGHWMRRQRDIVLVSQRGTGGDNCLNCELSGSDDNLQGYLDPIFDEAVFRRCLADLSGRFELRHYGTATAMDDLNDARAALGYLKINLYAGSYGSRAALEYLRRHSDTLRTVMLNSVDPTNFVNPLFHAQSAQEALEKIFVECETTRERRQAFGDLRARFQTVLERLDSQPAIATVRHPTTGKPQKVRLSRDAFLETLRVLMYSDSRQVPLLICRAYSGDFDLVAQRGLERNRALRSSIAFGMLLCVTCAEDVARIDPDTIPLLCEGTFYGERRVREQLAVCAFWPRCDVPANFAEPVVSDVPTLLLSGTLDPVTPPRFAAAAAQHLRNSRHVLVPGGHGVGGPCVDGLLKQVLTSGHVKDLDTSCIVEMVLPGFAIDAAATQPASSGRADSPPTLRPGARITLKFPELPQTLSALQSGKKLTAQLYIALPENYSANRKFPLFVFLYGGHGGEGAGPGRGQEIMENRDCIFVNLPLFKSKFDPDGPFKGLLITTVQDRETICQAYTAMLKKVYATIPNIDTAHNTIGGMSNGANAIVAMFEKGDAYLTDTFRNLILIEGGWPSIKTFERYRGKEILYLYGDYAGQNDSLGKRMREDLPKAVKKFADAAAANEINATGLVMPDTGHDMPARFNPDVRKWVVRQLAQ